VTGNLWPCAICPCCCCCCLLSADPSGDTRLAAWPGPRGLPASLHHAWHPNAWRLSLPSPPPSACCPPSTTRALSSAGRVKRARSQHLPPRRLVVAELVAVVLEDLVAVAPLALLVPVELPTLHAGYLGLRCVRLAPYLSSQCAQHTCGAPRFMRPLSYPPQSTLVVSPRCPRAPPRSCRSSSLGRPPCLPHTARTARRSGCAATCSRRLFCSNKLQGRALRVAGCANNRHAPC